MKTLDSKPLTLTCTASGVWQAQNLAPLNSNGYQKTLIITRIDALGGIWVAFWDSYLSESTPAPIEIAASFPDYAQMRRQMKREFLSDPDACQWFKDGVLDENPKVKETIEKSRRTRRSHW
ncbi:MAG TPA: hypothetical protein V6D27_01185 [Vampirovibrionales bacterium]